MVTLQAQQIIPTEPIPPKSLLIKTDKPRPYVCATCTRSFARLEHLKRHERSHTKEKPFQCPVCERSFARRDLLLRHKQKLHASFSPPKSEDIKDPVQQRKSTSTQRQSISAGTASSGRKPLTPGGGSASPRQSLSPSVRDQTTSTGHANFMHPSNSLENELVAMRSLTAPYRMFTRESRASSFSASSGTNYVRATEHGIPGLNGTPPDPSPSDVQFSTPQAYATDMAGSPDMIELANGNNQFRVPFTSSEGSADHNSVSGGSSIGNTINPQLLRSDSQEPYDFPQISHDSHNHGGQSVGTPQTHPAPGYRNSVASIPSRAMSSAGQNRHRSMSLYAEGSVDYQDSPAYSIPSVASVSNWDSPMAHVPGTVGSVGSYALSPPYSSNGMYSSSIPSRGLSKPSILNNGSFTNDDVAETVAKQGDEFINSFLNLDQTDSQNTTQRSHLNSGSGVAVLPVEGDEPWTVFNESGGSLPTMYGNSDADNTHVTSTFTSVPGAINFDTAFPSTFNSSGDVLGGSAYTSNAGISIPKSFDKNLYGIMNTIQSQNVESGDGFSNGVYSASAYSSVSFANPGQRHANYEPQVAKPRPSAIPAGLKKNNYYSSAHSLPTSQDVRRYVAAFYQDFNQHMQFIHRTTEMNSQNMALIMSMSSIGALVLNEGSAAHNIYEIAKDLIRTQMDSENTKSMGPPLILIQAAVLSMLYAHFHEKKEENDYAISLKESIIQMARVAKLNVSPSKVLPPLNWRKASITEKWKYFLQYQSRNRTMYMIFCVDSFLASCYGLPLHSSVSDLSCGSCAPEHLWNTSSAEEWWNIVQTEDRESNILSGPDFAPVFSSITRGEPVTGVPLHQFDLMTILAGIHAELARRTQAQIANGTGPHSTHDVLDMLSAFETTRTLVPQALDPSYEVGLIMADGVPLLALAYIRCFVGIVPAKMRFWSRDFAGMELDLDSLRHSNPDGLIDASIHALETISLAETQLQSPGKMFLPLFHGLFESALILSEGLEYIESMAQPIEKHQELLMRSHKLLSRVLEAESTTGGMFVGLDPTESLGHMALRVVHSVIRRGMIWPYASVMLEALESRM